MAGYNTDPENGGRRQAGVAVFFVLLAVVVSYMPSAAQQQVASTLRSTILRPFVLTQGLLAQARLQATESSRLRAQLDTLTAEVVRRTHLAEENRRLRRLLSVAVRAGPAWVGASVIRPGTVGSESMFLLDVGSEDDVRVNAPIITSHGLVGQVREIRPGSSIGMDWTHPDFRASAMSLDGTTYGLVMSRQGDFREEDRLVLDGTAFHSNLEEGTPVVTSGLGGVYPRGIPIGLVDGVAEAEAGWRKSYWLEPMVGPGSVTHVLVAAAARDSVEAEAPGDLSPLWPADSIRTSGERVAPTDSAGGAE